MEKSDFNFDFSKKLKSIEKKDWNGFQPINHFKDMLLWSKILLNFKDPFDNILEISKNIYFQWNKNNRSTVNNKTYIEWIKHISKVSLGQNFLGQCFNIKLNFRMAIKNLIGLLLFVGVVSSLIPMNIFSVQLNMLLFSDGVLTVPFLTDPNVNWCFVF